MNGPAGIKDVAERAERLHRHGLQRAQPARIWCGRPPGRGSRRRSPSSASSATTRPANCAPAAAASSRTCSSTPATRSSPTSLAAPRRPSRESGLALVMCNSNGEAAREAEYLDLLLAAARARRAHHRRRRRRARCCAACRRSVCRSCFVDRRASGAQDWCSVGVDDVRGGEVAVDPPDRAGARADRVRRRSAVDPPGRRPARGRAARDRRGRPRRRATWS